MPQQFRGVMPQQSRVAQGRALGLGGSFGYYSIRFQAVSEVVSRKSGTTDTLTVSFEIFSYFRYFRYFEVRFLRFSRFFVFFDFESM